MSAYSSIGRFTIDTGFNEPEWASPQSWVYEAKVDPILTFLSPGQPTNTALFNIMCTAEVARARTQFNAGSTSFPGAIGDRRILIICEVWVQFIRPIANFTGVGLDQVTWQLVRVN